MLRVVRRSALLAGLALVAAGLVPPAAAQVVPYLEPLWTAGADPRPLRDSPPARPPAAGPRVARSAPVAEELPPAPVIEVSADVRGESRVLESLPDVVSNLFAVFGGAAGDGAVRSGTTWVGQVTQQSGMIAVGGTARDDNGWGASGLALDATGQTFLNITAQRDAGNLAPTLFIQFEDLSLRTKVVSVSTSLFAFGSPTLVQVPLNGWTIDFGPSQIVSWSLGGGGLGTVDFRMSFDSLGFTATAIPEPAAVTSAAALLALGAAAWRRGRRSGPRG
jgi:hypothetical protein